LSHDFDLSRANRSRQIAALASAQASAEAVDAARIEARALAARLYAAHVGAAERRAVAVATVRAFEDALSLARARTRAGLGSELDVAQAQTALARARAAVPRLEAARDGARFGLESLLGLEPGALAEALAGAVSTPTVDPTPVLRTPVEVLASRPDLRVAERELVAAGATTAAAVRDRWPRLSLEAALGVQSVRVPWPLAADGLVQSLLLGVTAPLFDFGRLEARADAARARERAAAVAYRQAVFNALGEVETGINQFSRALAEGRLNDDAVDAASGQVALARARWRSGLVPFLDVVLAEQALYFAQAERALSRTRTLDAFTALSAAMGLGR
jgi:outer membrane protein TolC